MDTSDLLDPEKMAEVEKRFLRPPSEKESQKEEEFEAREMKKYLKAYQA